jgi:hypothetical protein
MAMGPVPVEFNVLADSSTPELNEKTARLGVPPLLSASR